MRDYLLRGRVAPTLVMALFALCVTKCLGQEDDEFRAYFPPAKPAESAGDEVQKLFKLIRHGSAIDRTSFRQELMRLGADAVPRLLAELESGNQLFSWAALVLGEIRDPRALEPLGRVASEQSRGDPLTASLALGRYDEAAALGPLIVQLLSGRARVARRAAGFALGRLQRPEGTAKILEVAREAKQSYDLAAALVALGMSGDPSVLPEIKRRLHATDDRVRRAAVVALGLLPASEEVEQAALTRMSDEDPRVLVAALAALAVIASPETAAALSATASLAGHTDERVRAAVTLVVAARGGIGSEPFLARRLLDPSERVREAAIGGLAACPTPHGDAMVIKGLDASQHSQVRLVSVITLAVLAGKRGAMLDLSAWFDDRDAAVRDAALVAHAWLHGPAAKPVLSRVVDSRKEDRLVRRAQAMLLTLEASPDLSHRLLRAELQVLLDDAEAAASWATHRLANEQIVIALGLENALQEFGGTDERTRTGAIRRPPPRLEDLRRHLDAFPYSDKRASIEVPLLRRR
jgi:HEAT repeat protein